MNVTLTKDFRLTSDERNFIVERRAVVDPTRSPSWAARKAADPTLSDAVKEEWREDTSPYYPLNAVGLTAAIQNVVIRQAVTDVAASAKLADFLALIQREMRTVTDAVDALLKPVEPRYGSAEFPYVYHEDSVDGRTLVPEAVARNLRR